MEDNAGQSASTFVGCRHAFKRSNPVLDSQCSTMRLSFRGPLLLAVALLALFSSSCASGRHEDALAHVKRTGKLVYGSDKEGGGPYIFPNPESPRDVVGFEVELMTALARDVGAKPVFSQGQWDQLLQNLNAGLVDLVINGYEWTETRAQNFIATRPYYVYRLQLMTRRGGPIRSLDDLRRPGAGGGKWKVAVLAASGAERFLSQQESRHVEIIRCSGTTDAMTAVANRQYDATLQDLPAARFYRERFPTLDFVGDAVAGGVYVIYFRRGDEPLRDAIDRQLSHLIDSGELRELYRRYGLWDQAQEVLVTLTRDSFRVSSTPDLKGLPLLRRYAWALFEASIVTIVLSVVSMPLAMILGLLVALGRLYGPAPLRVVLSGYVELLRGTPLMLQLFVLFYLLNLGPWKSAIIGLAVNYSAYEAEIYRAGLQAIPVGQMEAALALGMSRTLALRRVIVPQAVRIVIPPVTNDFIALFKDTAVCSVINMVELTKQYSILANSTGGVVEFAIATSALYLAMSLPLSWFSRWSEGRLRGFARKGAELE
ncbi:MAG: ABC transporter substrate-binding protein/permease [Isosphaeraceae bacterium]